MKMTNLSTEFSPQGEQYGVLFLQEYASKKIGNREYIFWLIDCEEEGKPRIRVCVWQPETAGSTPFSLYDYEALL